MEGKPFNTLAEADRCRYYNLCLVRSLESKLDRVEPLSAEFEATMAQIFEAQDRIQVAGLECIRLRCEAAQEQRQAELSALEHSAR